MKKINKHLVLNKQIKILFSLLWILFSWGALYDILAGQEKVLDEVIVLIFAGLWFLYLIKPFKLAKFLFFLLLSLASLILHNVLSHLLRFKEGFFFILIFLFLFLSVYYFFAGLFKQFKK
jgi:hypothetical protein